MGQGRLNLDLSKASMLQGVVAVGVAIGAILAARMITLRKSVRVIPLGMAMGIGVIVMIAVRDMWLAVPLLVLIGIFSGFFVVPMNALLQHRGHILMGAGPFHRGAELQREPVDPDHDQYLLRAAQGTTVDLLDHRPCSACSSPAPCGWSSVATRPTSANATTSPTWKTSPTTERSGSLALLHGPPHEAKILPGPGLVLRAAQQVGRVVADDQRDPAIVVQPATRRADLDVRLQQRLRRGAAQGDNQFGPDQFDLSYQIRTYRQRSLQAPACGSRAAGI
jgi:hypothetical protein